LYIFDRLAEKQFPYQNRNKVVTDRRLKIESPTHRHIQRARSNRTKFIAIYWSTNRLPGYFYF